ncbi:unnamed protein product [Periconia digitata]|uniref:Apple domain-containing protein n=1 Tax=Periconia digitata TaxID=1303443 RepID=A0A9W4XEA6_9PLEO|nr:unnamed protein product [Periconia digitata]
MNETVTRYFPRNSSPEDCTNGTIITSLQGLNYTQYCNSDIVAHDRDNSEMATLQECIDTCTQHGPACLGVVWIFVYKKCYLKDTSVTKSDLVSHVSGISALASEKQYEQRRADFACPYPNMSLQKSRLGMDLKIFCGSIFRFHGVGILDKVHVKSLDECMERCSSSHPLCARFIYGADLVGLGWLNCWLAKSGGDDLLVPWTRTMAHSGITVINVLDKPNWKNDSVQVDSSGRSFKISRDDFRDLNNSKVPFLAAYHEKTVQSCMDRCSEVENACIAATFDSGLQQGFLNCYLFRNLPPPHSRDPDHTFFYLQSRSDQYQPPPIQVRAHLNGGQISSAVLGGLFVLGIILGGVWHLKSKRKSKLKAG